MHLTNQFIRANETATLRLETISAQKREIEALKGGSGDKSSGSIPGGDDAASQLILVIGQAYKVNPPHPSSFIYETQIYFSSKKRKQETIPMINAIGWHSHAAC